MATLTIPIFNVYFFSFYGVIGIVLLYLLSRCLFRHYRPGLRVRAAQFRYTTNRWRLWPEITWLRLHLLILYFIANAIILIVETEQLSGLESKAAITALINLMLVFLGGRTNIVADSLGISLPTYYFAHRWIGYTAIFEALLHSWLVLLRRRRLDAITQSGITVRVTRALPPFSL